MRDPDKPFPRGFLVLVAVTFVAMVGLTILTSLPDQFDQVQVFLQQHLRR